MSSLRIARAALRARPAAIARPIQRRGYAEVANDKIKLSLALPHQSIYKSQDVVQVNLPAETGDMGVLANHVASIEQLKPGLVEIIEEQGGSKQFFLSGGFAVVQPNSVLSINAVEGYPLEDFSAEAVRNQIGEAQKIASGNGSEADIAEAKIELEGRFEAPATIPGAGEAKQPYPTTSRRKSSSPSALPLPQASSEPQPPPSGRKSPAYLQGRNPYGRVLDKVQHPYREPEAVTTAPVPPSQAGSNIGSRSPAVGVTDSKQQSLAQEPGRHGTQTTYPPSRQPQVPKSVRSAKDFFETEAFQRPSASRPPPSVPGTSAAKALAPQTYPPSSSLESPAHAPNPKLSSTTDEQALDTGLLLSSLTEFYDTRESVQSVISYKQGEADECAPIITTQKATPPAVPSDQGEEQYFSDIERESIGRRKSTNIFAGKSDGAKLPSLGQQAGQDSFASDAISKAPLPDTGGANPVDHIDPSDKIVRRLATRNSIPAAETKQANNPNPPSQQEGRRAKSGRDLRRTFEEDNGISPKRLRRSGSHTASLMESGTSAKEPVDRVAEWTQSTDIGNSRNQSGKSIGVRRRAEEIVARNLGHDGASDMSVSRQSCISGSIPTANIGVEEQYGETKVPDDVDNRQGYGRRVTQDFGFPGARIKSYGINKTSRPLRDPGNWTKRACGHFSYMGKTEHREHAQEKICRQCSTRVPVLEELLSTKRRTRRRASSESLTSTTPSSKISTDDCCRRQRRRRCHSESMSHDRCGDRFADELGHIIDNILEEHANTLQNVISNIKNTQPSLDQLRRVSGDLVQRCNTNGCDRNRCRTSCRSAHESCRRDDDWLPPCPYLPPKAAEKLNVGATGQVKPNLNDPQSSLREEVQSIPDLVDLVKSAADDLGFDLDRRPTATDDDMFHNAPYETTPMGSASRHTDFSIGTAENRATEDEPLTEDSWLQQTRRHLTELSEAREQLMDELDSIAGDLDVKFRDQPEVESVTDSDAPHAHRVLSKAPTGLSRTSTLQRDALIDSVQRMLSKAPTGISRSSTWHEQNLGEETADDLDFSKAPSGISRSSTWHEQSQGKAADDLDFNPAQRRSSKNPTGLSRTSTSQKDAMIDSVQRVQRVQRVLSKIPTGLSRSATRHGEDEGNEEEKEAADNRSLGLVQRVLSPTPADFSRTSTSQADAIVDSVQRVQRVLSKIPTGLSRSSTWHAEDEEAVEDPDIEPVQRVLSISPPGILQASTWIRDASVDATRRVLSKPLTGLLRNTTWHGIGDDPADSSFVEPVQRVLSKALIGLSRNSTWQKDDDAPVDEAVESVERGLSKAPTSTGQHDDEDEPFGELTQPTLEKTNSGLSRASTWHGSRSFDYEEPGADVTGLHNDDLVAKIVQSVLSKVPSGFSRASTWQGNKTVDIEDLGADISDHREDDLVTATVQRVLSKASTGISSRPTWPSSNAANTVEDEVQSVVDKSVDELRLSRALTRILSQPKEPPSAGQEPYKAEDVSPEEI
ncbi:uncharacterized protein J4E92_002553 [Alternaria infectoria]|uniref:uncharacterized protein n=1 Tax=Alternaria infectoria TaxID=45303 RepID=UPI00221FCEDD|nr:uncharacterized protein J4E92_002553 [Alternaria infectoria]KAI4935265.1 hypothetical protein J4E92_002553 [Alternaria infectoria]